MRNRQSNFVRVLAILFINYTMKFSVNRVIRAGGRAVDLGGPSVYQGGPKFEIKHNSRCFQKSKLVDWGAKHVNWGSPAPLPPPLAPALRVIVKSTKI